MRDRLLVAATVLIMAACSGGGGSGGVRRDLARPADLGAGVVDLASEVDLAEEPSQCAAARDYGNVGAREGTAEGGVDEDSGDEYALWSGAIDGAQQDFAYLELYAGFGALKGSSSIKTGTFKLSGEDLNYGTCGICVLVGGDVDDQGSPTEIYMATAGTVTITSASGSLKVAVDNARFEKVTIDPGDYTSTPVGDGCTTALTGLRIDEALP